MQFPFTHLSIIIALLGTNLLPTITAAESRFQKKIPRGKVAPILLKHRAPLEQLSIDYGRLATCKDKSDCFPWQVCASCKTKTFGATVKYCSDYNSKGLCNYADAKMVCGCSEPPLSPALYPKTMIGEVEGYCITDEDCEIKRAPTQGRNLGFRCSTCILETIGGNIYSWRNLCSAPSDNSMYTCSAAWAATCSCGQLKSSRSQPTAILSAPPPPAAGGNIASPFLVDSPPDDAAQRDNLFGIPSGNQFEEAQGNSNLAVSEFWT